MREWPAQLDVPTTDHSCKRVFHSLDDRITKLKNLSLGDGGEDPVFLNTHDRDSLSVANRASIVSSCSELSEV